MSSEQIDRLEEWKSRFDPAGAHDLEALLTSLASEKFAAAQDLTRLHETLLFLRAYPLTERVARQADEILFAFAERLAAQGDLDPFEEAEVSGIAGTSLTAVFSYEVAQRLAALNPRHVEIAWDRHDEQDRLGPVVRKFLPMLNEDWPVEAHVPFAQWIGAAHRHSQSDLEWLLQRVTGAEMYDS